MKQIIPLFFYIFLPFLSLAETISYDEHGSDWTGTCASGLYQSPIDFSDVVGPCDKSMIFDLSFDSGTSSIKMYDDGVTFKSLYTGSSLFASDVNGVLTGYQSVNIHFHAPSEHTIEGVQYALELHILHSITSQFAAKGQTSYTYGAVSILFEEDSSASANPFITALQLGSLNTALQLDFNSLLYSQLPSPLPYYTYHGSVTVPPCPETVNWYVISTPLKITPGQLLYFTKRFAGNSTFADGNGNNRELQPVNDRPIKKGGESCEEQFVYFFSFIILFIFINYFVFKLM